MKRCWSPEFIEYNRADPNNKQTPNSHQEHQHADASQHVRGPFLEALQIQSHLDAYVDAVRVPSRSGTLATTSAI